MGKLYDTIDDRIRAFIEAQPMFFVGSAPLARDGHVNISPKGLDSLRVLGPRRVAYLDFVGSGVETIAHVKENERLVLMFCSFKKKPLIVRLWGKGRVVEPGDAQWAELFKPFPASGAARSIICLDVERIQDSCGYGVPRMHFESQREQLALWAERKGEEAIQQYKADRNAQSIDGLPGVRRQVT